MDHDLRMRIRMTVPLERALNVVALLGVLVVLTGSLLLQFGVGEQPCPLCLVQRSGMIGLAVGPVMNLLWGLRAQFYALSILAALVGGAGSVRQILLHIATPGDPGYGPQVLGFHLYTWADITFVAAIALIAVILLFREPLEAHDRGLLAEGASRMRAIAIGTMLWVAAYAVIIAVSVIPECGVGMCPDDPADIAGLGMPLAGGIALAIAIASYAAGFAIDRRIGSPARMSPPAAR